MTLALPEFRMAGSLGAHERFMRNVLFLACFLLVSLTVAPFPDLGDPRLLEPIGAGSPVGQISILILTAALCVFVLARERRVALRAVTPILIATLCWFAFTAVVSAHPELAVRRLVLAVFTIANAAALLLLPNGREHFGRLLAAGALIILATCYLGVLLLPQYAIHQGTDVIESSLAGHWRGPFGHKNGAGAMMVVLIFVGIFVARTASRVAGIAIIVGASIFLPFTMSKSPMGLLPVVVGLSFLVLRLHSTAARYALVIATLIFVNLLTIGTVAIEPVGDLLAAVMPDSSFTGRDEIWRFALDHVVEKPITGFGFQAFWGTSDLVFNWDVNASWGLRASDAHNGYLNIAVMTGLTGLALSLAWIVGQPLADLSSSGARSFDRPLTLLFTQIWIFGLCLSGTESVLFSGGDTLWFMMIVSIVGLRLQRVSQLSG
jgi:O-antigen ligase